MIIYKSPLDTELKITKINCGKEDKLRLYKLGVKEKQKVKVEVKLFSGGVFVDVDGTLVGIGKEISKNIEVELWKE